MDILPMNLEFYFTRAINKLGNYLKYFFLLNCEQDKSCRNLDNVCRFFIKTVFRKDPFIYFFLLFFKFSHQKSWIFARTSYRHFLNSQMIFYDFLNIFFQNLGVIQKSWVFRQRLRAFKTNFFLRSSSQEILDVLRKK